ncbi:MAG: hypothetical protein COA74_04920 [Gammaproteobacteria bacterium]|nr:MAG: hypothetical protein COA74_04920 [Gammaproteobacteria bacterium]
MPDKHFYFSTGAALGTLLCWILAKTRHKLQQSNFFIKALYKKDRHWFLFFPILIFIIGMWGLIPDILHVLRILPKEITRGSFFNIFFFHSYFEQIEDIYPFINRLLNWIGEIILLSLSVGIMVFYIKQIKRALHSRTPTN